VDPQEVLAVLGVETEPEVDEKEDAPMPFFMGESLEEEIDRLLDETMNKVDSKELEEMSSMSGGSVEGYSGGGKKKSLIREEEPEVVEEVLNYLLSKMEIL
jgi:hypothetical protein